MLSDYIDHPADRANANHKAANPSSDKQRPAHDKAGQLRQIPQKFPGDHRWALHMRATAGLGW